MPSRTGRSPAGTSGSRLPRTRTACPRDDQHRCRYKTISLTSEVMSGGTRHYLGSRLGSKACSSPRTSCWETPKGSPTGCLSARMATKAIAGPDGGLDPADVITRVELALIQPRANARPSQVIRQPPHEIAIRTSIGEKCLHARPAAVTRHAPFGADNGIIDAATSDSVPHPPVLGIPDSAAELGVGHARQGIARARRQPGEWPFPGRLPRARKVLVT